MPRSNKCPNCAGFFAYSPKDKALKCKSCGAILDINASNVIKQHDYETTKTLYDNSWVKDKRQMRCKSCGANVLVDNFSLVDKCSYCGSSMLIDVEGVAVIKPDAVLPFAIDEQQAREFFKTGLKGKMFVPNVLKKHLPETAVTPRYVNAYVFNAKLDVVYSGRLKYRETETDSDGHTTTHTYTRYVSGTIEHSVIDEVIESSSNLSQTELLAISPFDLSQLKAYNGDYLFGSSAEYSDKSLEDANRELEQIVKNNVTQRIVRRHHADGVEHLDLSLNYKNKKYCYCLLPTYVFDYEFNGKHYHTLMNGINGKLGGGVPRSAKKITSFVLAILAVILGIGLLIYLIV